MDEPDIRKRTFDFAVRVINLCKALDQQSGTTRTIANQLLRSGTSIGANVAEAQAAQSKKDFIAKMAIASKESRETSYWIELLIETRLLPAKQLSPLKDESSELVAILTSIVKTSQLNTQN